MLDKKALTERDICTKYITPALTSSGWNLHTQIREEVQLTAGRVIVRGKLISRGEQKRADYVLFHKTNLPIAVVEAKDNNKPIGQGMQQALKYADMLNIPFAFSSNGDGFIFHDATNPDHPETAITLAEFPSPALLWRKYCRHKGIPDDRQTLITQAAEDSAWRDILTYFRSATQIGLTATPKETKDVSNTDYFGEPIYTYSLAQGIEDGFLAPYKVIRLDLDRDLQGWRPSKDQTDKYGTAIPDRIYNQQDFDRTLVLEQRTKLIAAKIMEFLRSDDPYAKTIVFCEDTEHADRMRHALVNASGSLGADERRYIMRITGDDPIGKAELDNFIDPESTYPVVVTTSQLMTTGVDAQTCKLIVLDQRIQSMTQFKQIIGRGTRLREDHDKYFFTIMDFKKATELFADPDFDGDPVQIYQPSIDDPITPPDDFSDDNSDEDESDVENIDGIVSKKPHSKREKLYIHDVDVRLVAERRQY
jgi:type I site-specific restriction endonuclease